MFTESGQSPLIDGIVVIVHAFGPVVMPAPGAWAKVASRSVFKRSFLETVFFIGGEAKAGRGK